jgi:hypothetical protein
LFISAQSEVRGQGSEVRLRAEGSRAQGSELRVRVRVSEIADL